VVSGIQPPLQVGLVFTQVDAGDTDLLEAELRGPFPDLFRQGVKLLL
jgi:hypothetical protein